MSDQPKILMVKFVHWITKEEVEIDCLDMRGMIDLVKKYDLMITERDGKIDYFIDDKGRKFRQR